MSEYCVFLFGENVDSGGVVDDDFCYSDGSYVFRSFNGAYSYLLSLIRSVPSTLSLSGAFIERTDGVQSWRDFYFAPSRCLALRQGSCGV